MAIFGLKDAQIIAGFLAERAGFPPAPNEDASVASYLGTPIYDFVKFPYDGNEATNIGSEGVSLSEVLITMSRPKKIVRTPIQGREGDVNEFISLGDYEINISGVLVSEEPLVQPTEALQELLLIADYSGAVVVASNYLNLFGIEQIVIDNFSPSQIEGYRNQIGFTIQAHSERPIELDIQTASNANS